MVPYHPRAFGCAQGARMLDLTQMDSPFGAKQARAGSTGGTAASKNQDPKEEGPIRWSV